MEANRLRILAIADNKDNLTTLKAVVRDRLPEAGVLTARNGPRGLELARAEDPDVILLDIVMPGIDGYAVCQEIKADKRLRTIPVLLLTALRTDRDSRVRALQAGAEGLLSKPFDEVELVAQIRAMARIKAANRLQRLEKEELAALVAERTRELEQELSERKRAEEARGRLSNIIERSLNEIYIFDPETLKFHHANLGALKNLQYTLEEIKELTPLDLKPEFTESSFRNMIQPLLANEQETLRFQTVHRRADGSLYPVEVHLQLVGAGSQRVFLAVMFDITERQQAEAARRDAETRYRLLFEQSPDGIVIIDPATARLLEFNETAHRQLGYSREEFARLSIPDLEAAETPEETQAHIAQVTCEGRNDFETRHCTRQGEIRDIHVTAQFTEMWGRPVYHCVWRDITDRKRAEEQTRQLLAAAEASRRTLLNVVEDQKRTETALRESETRLSEAQNMAQLGYWTWDVRTGHVEWSEEVFRIFHLDPREFTPHIDSILELSPWPEDRRRDRELIRKATETHEKGTYEQRFLRPDKSIGYYHSTFQGKYDDGSNLIFIVGTVQDITERKRTEEKIKGQLEELQRWQDVMLGREDRVQELKREVNDLCRRAGRPVRYPSQEVDPAESEDGNS